MRTMGGEGGTCLPEHNGNERLGGTFSDAYGGEKAENGNAPVSASCGPS